jgi:hypothetical protein
VITLNTAQGKENKITQRKTTVHSRYGIDEKKKITKKKLLKKSNNDSTRNKKRENHENEGGIWHLVNIDRSFKGAHRLHLKPL